MKKVYQTPEIEVKKLMMESIMDPGDPYAGFNISEDQNPISISDEN